ncbi:MAG: ATP-binding protein [Phycisphaerales bacterium]
MTWVWPIVTFVLGVAGAGLIARLVLARAIARTRDAERRARASEHLAEVGAMTGGLAHEIRNPLSTIGLNAQLLAEAVRDLGIPDAERARLARRTDALRHETERLGGILQDFLEFAGEMRIDPRPIDLRDLVNDLVDFYTPQAEASRVRLRADLPAGPVPAHADEGHVKQAVLNLVINAAQAMASMTGDGPREIIIRAHSTPGYAQLHVTDTGPGIDEATLARMFEPYFTTKSGGTGLGLPTSRRIVGAHGGHMAVHSEPGRGTDFVITLPAEAPA